MPNRRRCPCSLDGDRVRVATALLCWIEFHVGGGEGSEPDAGQVAERLAYELGVEVEFIEVRERLRSVERAVTVAVTG